MVVPARLSGEQGVGQGRDDAQGHDQGCKQCKSLGKSQRPEKLAFSRHHGEYRQEAHNGCGNCSQHSATHFSDGTQHYIPSIFTFFSLIEMPENVFGDDDPHIHNSADCNGNARKGHDVGVHAEDLHRNETEQNRQGQQP